MAASLSPDLRIRVIRAIEGGQSRTAAARRFGVSLASAVRWMQTYRRTGRTQAKPRGGDRRSHRIEAQADLLLRAIEQTPDLTLAELRARLLTERGESFALSTFTPSIAATGALLKKDCACPRTGPRRCSGATPSLGRLAIPTRSGAARLSR